MTDGRNLGRLAWIVALGAAAMTVPYRLAPYAWPDQGWMWHMMPVGALALFAGARLTSPWAVAVPLVATFLGDLLLIQPLAAIGQPSFTWATPLVYVSFAGYFLLGRGVRWLFPGSMSLPGALLAALAGGVQFFLVTNAASWLINLDGRYSPGLDGLFQSYAAALPFYRGTLQSDLLFTLYLFGAYELLLAVLPAPREAEQPA